MTEENGKLPLLRPEDKEALLDADDTQFEEVECPEWGFTLLLRGLDGDERQRYESKIAKQKGRNIQFNFKNMRGRLVQMSVVDPSNKRTKIFSMADIARLEKKSAAPLDRCFAAAQRISGLTDKDIEELTTDFFETDG